MLTHLLQTTLPVTEKFSPDSVAAKGAQLVETIRTTPADQLLEEAASAAIKFGLKVLLALVLYFVGAWLIRKIKKIIEKGFAKKNSDPTLSSFIQSLVTATLWVVLILAMVGTLGINTTSLAALLAAGGMAIGMALSGTVQNFAGGLMLLAFKPFKVGDFIEAQGYFGKIAKITIVHTKLITTDNREVTLPNGSLSNGIIDNYDSRSPQRLTVNFNVPYGTDFDELRSIVLELVKKSEKILYEDTTPGAKNPKVSLSSLDDSSVEVKLRVWIKPKDYKKVQYWLNENIYKELPKHGIQFPFPQMDVHLKQD